LSDYADYIKERRGHETDLAEHPFDVDKLKVKMLALPQVDCPVIHRFGPGVYIRELTIPADSLAIGHYQKFEHTNVLLKGRVTILNDDGTTSELSAPMIFVGKPGRKVGYVHEDMVWLNIYGTNEQDVSKLEAYYLRKDEDFITASSERAGVKLLQRNMSILDYQKMISDVGMTEEQVRKEVETNDVIELPFGSYKIRVAESTIDGRGLFATAAIEPDEVIAPARLGGKRTIAGRFTNHSAMPNAKMIRGDGTDIILVAAKRILGCQGGFNGDEITIDYRSAVALNRSIDGGDLCQQR
jgi:hypothetical protein